MWRGGKVELTYYTSHFAAECGQRIGGNANVTQIHGDRFHQPQSTLALHYQPIEEQLPIQFNKRPGITQRRRIDADRTRRSVVFLTGYSHCPCFSRRERTAARAASLATPAPA